VGQLRAAQVPRPSHQTVRLARGKHFSPDRGVCVMELASMLAGEKFTDRPYAVCPVIGAFARGYNDACDAERRQALYGWAASAIGTRGGEHVVLARERLLQAAALWVQAQLPLPRRRRAIGWRSVPEPPFQDLQRERLASLLARELVRMADGHVLAETLFEALVAVGERGRTPERSGVREPALASGR
jgi:hypothetical protein